ncbi:hypothetical protein ETH_00031845 [Eimeria tenella]|uniref:GCC2 and GCC3 domain-containing protein n=1 Tax=Eimeria tenella TaxID=5802 RepID=U6L510_EIMTE|nr:hypothetical protein ETH_00031845 [Eimeria tenella]CDJ42865.1 hypothetical protein ETH_00031845 [Eimeria tenella]|eukprot:XP_013233615.1 hypothetical protein ETH_00031845 [Eimeria tenella]
MDAQCVACDPGYECADGVRVACARGLYSDGSASCLPCKAGHYCSEEATTEEQMNKQKCPAGVFCDAGVDSIPTLASHPCKAGSYCPEADKTACVPVAAGQYASVEGLAEAEGSCSVGYYCPEGSTSATMHHCPAGKYSYLCYEGASSPRPTDGKTGEPCTAGGYCEEGATTKSYCPPGKYNPSPGASSKDDCIDCPAGKYCTGSHSPEPDGPCAPGAYCTGGSETSRWVTKTEGSTKCDPCTYGHYCPTEGTSTEVPCPLGTFRETGFGSSINSCYQCPPYKACTSTGNKELEKNLPYCEAGYYCIYGSPATQPSKDDETYDPNKAGPCPAGFYCETQQILTPCPRGSLGTNEMQRSATDCAKCPAGKVCQDIAGLTATECPEGFICPEGTMAAERVANLCPVGKFCPAGSTDGTNCAKGSFAPTKGMLECVKCPAGYLCEDPSLNLSQQPCPEGYFCPAASSDKQACPAGTVGFAENLSNESLCLRCPPGHYCPNEATAIPDNMEQCPPGKYSSRGSKDQSECKECPVGYYCPEASSTPIPCPGGMLCTAAGQEQPNEDCPEGFYCEAGTLQHSYSVAQVCPAGAYCPTNSSSPTLCPMGTTSQNQGATSETACTPCPAGRYVPLLTT